MGKRSNFERNPRDYYPTPREAVVPLGEHLESGLVYIEPCAGNGALIQHLTDLFGILKPELAADIEPQNELIVKRDALNVSLPLPVITNPPWDTKLLHPLLDHWIKTTPYCWLLLKADYKYTKKAAPYMEYCEKVVAIGRVSWLGNGVSGKDNCAWYKFLPNKTPTTFIGRQ